MNPKRAVNEDTPVRPDSGCLHVVLPGYRGPFAANDFIDLEVRSVDTAVAKYLGRHAGRVGWGSPRALVFQIATEKCDQAKEETTSAAYRDLFRYHGSTYWHEFIEQLPLTAALATIGMFMLWLSNYIGDTKLNENLKTTLSDIIQVGAWVAMWTAIAGLFSAAFISLRKYLAFRRLAGIPIKYEYSRAGTLVEEC